jgi:hypothetical protein
LPELSLARQLSTGFCWSELRVNHSLSERSRWILAIVCLTLSAVLFDIGWTSPFAYQQYSRLGVAWLSLPWVDVAVSLGAVASFIIGLWLLTRTKDLTTSLP